MSAAHLARTGRCGQGSRRRRSAQPSAGSSAAPRVLPVTSGASTWLGAAGGQRARLLAGAAARAKGWRPAARSRSPFALLSARIASPLQRLQPAALLRFAQRGGDPWELLT